MKLFFQYLRLIYGRHRCSDCWKLAVVHCDAIDPKTQRRCDKPLCDAHHFVDAHGLVYCFEHWLALNPDAPLMEDPL